LDPRSVAGEAPQSVRHRLRIEHERVFETGAEGHCRDVRTGDAADRGIQAGKTTLSELSGNLGAESAGAVGLVDHRHPPGLLDGAHASLDIPGGECAQIDDLDLDAARPPPAR